MPANDGDPERGRALAAELLIEERPDGTSALRVRAQPGARRPGVAGIWNGHLKLAIAAPPEKGRANAQILAALAERLDLRAGRLALLSGERSRLKLILVPLAAPELRRRLARHLGQLEGGSE